MLLALSFLTGSKIGKSFCISAYKCLRGLLLQRRTGVKAVHTGLGTRPTFVYRLWMFPFHCTSGFINSHRPIVRQRHNAIIWIMFTNLIFYHRCRRLFVKPQVC